MKIFRWCSKYGSKMFNLIYVLICCCSLCLNKRRILRKKDNWDGLFRDTKDFQIANFRKLITLRSILIIIVIIKLYSTYPAISIVIILFNFDLKWASLIDSIPFSWWLEHVKVFCSYIASHWTCVVLWYFRAILLKPLKMDDKQIFSLCHFKEDN